jgi:hypothetical protein
MMDYWSNCWWVEDCRDGWDLSIDIWFHGTLQHLNHLIELSVEGVERSRNVLAQLIEERLHFGNYGLRDW